MSEKDDELEVILDDAPGADDDIPGEKKPESTEDVLADMKRRLAGETERANRAEATAANHANEANRANVDVHEANLNLIKGAISSLSNDKAILKANYAAALDEGNHEAAAEIMSRMTETENNLRDLHAGKDALEQNKPQIRKVEPTRDPVEAMASSMDTPRAAAWIRAHPEYARDQKLTVRLLAAHNLAVTGDVPVNTDEYYDFVEKTLGITHSDEITPETRQTRQEGRTEPTTEKPMSSAADATQRRTSPAATPVSRGGTGTGTKPTVMRITREEAEMASSMGMTNEEYAKNKALLIKEGKLQNH